MTRHYTLVAAATLIALALPVTAQQPAIAPQVSAVGSHGGGSAFQSRPPAVQLQALGEGLRLWGTRALAETLPPPSTAANAVSEALAGLNVSGRGLLSALWGQSIQHIHVAGNRAIVGWWHPLIDGWTVTSWTLTPEGWRLDQMGFVLGETLAQEPQPWTEAAPSARQAIQLHCARAVLAFDTAARSGGLERSFSPEGGRTARDTLLLRLANQQEHLDISARTTGYSRYHAALESSLVTHPATITGPGSIGRSITELPGEVRITLRPIGAFQRPDGLTFAVQSPLAPRIIVFVHFVALDGGEATPARVDIEELGL